MPPPVLLWQLDDDFSQADTPEAVLTNVERLEYVTDSVSWTKEGGTCILESVSDSGRATDGDAGEFFIYTKTNSRHPLAFRTGADGITTSTRTRATRSRA